jgi:hypothetical protein
MKAYVVTSGEYSDYHICGVFNESETAQKFIDSFKASNYEQMNIEEWELNQWKVELKNGYRPYFIRLDVSNFNTIEVYIESSTYGYTEDLSQRDGVDVKGNFFTHCFAKDKKHAAKIASERLAKFKVEKFI